MRSSTSSSRTSTSIDGQIDAIGRALPSEPYPSTEAAWRDRYLSLINAYEQGAYTDGEVRADHLFAAIDDSGKEIDIARRLFGFFRFITDVDARALIGPKGLTLEVEEPGPAALLAEGEAVWRRSKLAQKVITWATLTAAEGDYYLEAVRTNNAAPFDTKIVGYPPEWVTPVYDEFGHDLIRIEVDFIYLDEPAPGAFALTEATQHSYRRIIDRTHVEVFRDGKSEGKKPHYAGVVPVVHLTWKPWMGPEHSLPAAHGLDAAIARLNSFAAQVGAISNRYADPKTVVTGARVGSSDDIGLFGRILSISSPDAKVTYLEAGAAALGPILDVMREVIQHVRETAPEFLFADSAASESGTARSYRASALEMKIGEARNLILPAIAEITGIAVAMDNNAVYRPEAYPFCVDAAPFIRPDVDGEVQTLVSAAPYLLRADIVRRLQSLGIASDDLTVEAYLKAKEDESAMAGGPVMDDLGAEDGLVPGKGGANKVADAALNGAQISGLLEVVQAVATGMLAEAAAVELLAQAFPTIAKAEAAKIIAGAVKIKQATAVLPDRASPASTQMEPPEKDMEDDMEEPETAME